MFILDSSSDDDSTLDSDKTPVKAKSGTKESNNNSSSKQHATDVPKPRPRLLRHRSKSRDPHHANPESPSGNGVSPMQRLLNEEQRLRKQNKVRKSLIILSQK